MSLSIETIIRATGYLGLFGIVFAESGLFIGFFLPGDSLLFTAGFLASQGFIDIKILILIVFTAAVLGDSFGYVIGQKFGPKIFKHKNSSLFNKDHIERSERFYEKHGGKTIILARFMPVVRTFAPILAGVGGMPYRSFVMYNVVGGFLWSVGLSLLGYFLGQTIPNVDRYLLPIIALIILISATPSAIHILKSPTQRQKLLKFLKRH